MVCCTLFTSCNNQSKGSADNNNQKDTGLELSSQDNPSELKLNKQVADTIDGGMMLLGPINAEGLNQEPYALWFEENSKHGTNLCKETQVGSFLLIIDETQTDVIEN